MAIWQKGLTSKQLAFEMFREVTESKDRLTKLFARSQGSDKSFNFADDVSCRRIVVAALFDVYQRFYRRYGLKARTLIPFLREESPNWSDFNGFEIGRLLAEFDTALTESAVASAYDGKWRVGYVDDNILNAWQYRIIFDPEEPEWDLDIGDWMVLFFEDWANRTLYKQVWRH